MNVLETESVPSLSAIILAGGHSTRMGIDKALLQINGRSLIEHSYRMASSCTDTVYVVTPWPDRYRALLPHCQWAIEPTSEPQSSPGPLIGFARALAQPSSDWVLLLACDLPKLRADLLRSGAAMLGSIPEQYSALLCRTDVGWEPLCGFYHRRCKASLDRFVATGGRSFQGWLSREAVMPWPIDDLDSFFNCNTPADWRQARAQIPPRSGQ